LTLPRLAERQVPAIAPEQNFIAGQACLGRGEAIAVTFPVTGEHLATLHGADEAQIEQALAAARTSFDQGVWSRQTPSARARVLERMAELLEAQKNELATLVQFDNGKTRGEAMGDVAACAAGLRNNARYAETLVEPAPSAEPDRIKMIWREPAGVVAALTPFNAPLMFAGIKAAPALAAGCSVILKCSERAPLLPIALCRVAQEAGLPPGVLQLLHGRADVAARLCADPRVDLITLTGGTKTGSAVMAAAAPTVKNVLLELGGKSAHILLADADLERALPAVIQGAFRNAGQRCLSGTRLLVDRKIAREVEERLVELTKAVKVGDPFDPATEVGALIDDAALVACEAFVAKAQEEGLELAAGGHRIESLRPGSFFHPALLLGANSKSWAAREELFGPALTVIEIDGPEEAIAVANDSRYGLAGGVWTRDQDQALEIARRVRSGYFWINTWGVISGDLPFGGFGLSGIGREAGRAGFEAYTELKSVVVETGSSDSVLSYLDGSTSGAQSRR
jgi:acyl-CoA reductase-like NAD-dependent aldehyde dehydrogenase